VALCAVLVALCALVGESESKSESLLDFLDPYSCFVPVCEWVCACVYVFVDGLGGVRVFVVL